MTRDGSAGGLPIAAGRAALIALTPIALTLSVAGCGATAEPSATSSRDTAWDASAAACWGDLATMPS